MIIIKILIDLQDILKILVILVQQTEIKEKDLISSQMDRPVLNLGSEINFLIQITTGNQGPKL